MLLVILKVKFSLLKHLIPYFPPTYLSYKTTTYLSNAKPPACPPPPPSSYPPIPRPHTYPQPTRTNCLPAPTGPHLSLENCLPPAYTPPTALTTFPPPPLQLNPRQLLTPTFTYPRTLKYVTQVPSFLIKNWLFLYIVLFSFEFS